MLSSYTHVLGFRVLGVLFQPDTTFPSAGGAESGRLLGQNPRGGLGFGVEGLKQSACSAWFWGFDLRCSLPHEQIAAS